MEIYTDGGCIENPGGIGAWAFVVVMNGQLIWKESGAELETTNNRMELTAVIQALEWLKNEGATLYTDSQLTIKCGTGKWKRKANLDLWFAFSKAWKGPQKHPLRWIKGHSGNKWNDMADSMCAEEMEKLLGFREARIVMDFGSEERR